MSQSKPYWRSLDKAAQTRLDELAELCELGRTSFHQASANGFFAHSGSEAELLQTATTRSDWPAGPWPISAANPLHQIGLMIGLSASGHLGEMSGLLRTGEVMWSLPLVSRAVVENCGRLFAIYLKAATSSRARYDSGRLAVPSLTGLRLHRFDRAPSRLRKVSVAQKDRKRREGKRHHQAVIALARRRVNVLWAMLRDEEAFKSRAA